MKYLWNKIDSLDWNEASKYTLAIWMGSMIAAAAGVFIWMIIRPFGLSTADWGMCFGGYPVVASWIYVFLYACNHSFHTGSNIPVEPEFRERMI